MAETRDKVSVDYASLKREVDALQIAIMSNRTPWYKSTSTLISIIALLFSFGTTIESYYRTREQSIHSDRVELRALLQRLAALPKEDVDIKIKHQSDAATAYLLSGFIAQENALLARQSAEVARKLPQTYVSSTEYNAIAIALENSFNLKLAREFYTLAINNAVDLVDKASSLRGRANNLFNSKEAAAGRVDYQAALNIFDKNDVVYNDFLRNSFHVATELSWAYAEANLGDRAIALQHVEAAKKLADVLPQGPGTQQIFSNINQARGRFSNESAPFVPAVIPQVPVQPLR